MEAHISNDHIITDLNFLNNKIMFYMRFMYLQISLELLDIIL